MFKNCPKSRIQELVENAKIEYVIPFGAENHDTLVKVVMFHSEGYLMMYGYLKL